MPACQATLRSSQDRRGWRYSMTPFRPQVDDLLVILPNPELQYVLVQRRQLSAALSRLAWLPRPAASRGPLAPTCWELTEDHPSWEGRHVHDRARYCSRGARCGGLYERSAGCLRRDKRRCPRWRRSRRRRGERASGWQSDRRPAWRTLEAPPAAGLGDTVNSSIGSAIPLSRGRPRDRNVDIEARPNKGADRVGDEDLAGRRPEHKLGPRC